MTLFAGLKFRTKLILGISAIVVGISLILAPLVTDMASDALVRESKKRGTALAEGLAARALDPLLAEDLLRLKNMVDQVVAVDDSMDYAFILGPRGYVLVHTFAGGFPVELIGANIPAGDDIRVQLLDASGERIYDFAAPVQVGDERLGTVRLGLSKASIEATVRSLVQAIATVSFMALGLAILLTVLFSNHVTKRLATLRQHAEDMVKGDLDIQTGPKLTRNCWQLLDCDRRACPAWGESRLRCWYLAGTLCPECDGQEFPEKLETCRDCPVYLENVGDEIQDLAETFDVMALTIKTHIQELRDAEDRLMRQQEVLRTILDVSPDLISLLDRDLRYQAVNRAFAEFVGLPMAEVIGKRDEDFRDPEDARRRTAENTRVLEGGRRIHSESRRETPNGPRWFRSVQLPVKDAEGRIVGVVRTARDVTEIKSYQEQLIQSQKMESIGKLAGGVAHEVNTPLGIILGYAQMLLEDVEPGSQVHDDLRVIERQTKVCRRIVADLLGFSRQAESAKIEMCFNNSVMEAVSLVRHAFGLDRVEIRTQMDDRFPIIYGDPEKLKQVWINLLTNARDAMPEGGVILVRTELDVPAQRVTAQVADTGSGIGEDDLGRIFDPFFTTKPVDRGTGLGLAVSFGIVEDHGGEITAASPRPPELAIDDIPQGTVQGPGTVFTVHLPLDHQASDAERSTSVERLAEQDADTPQEEN